MSSKEFITSSDKETKILGEKVGENLKPFDIVALIGPLGSGKTTFVKGIAQGLNIKEDITSPTFILVNEYRGRHPLYHIDLYRLDRVQQIEEIGIEEYFEKDGIVIIEWAEKLNELTPKHAKPVYFSFISENQRKIVIDNDLLRNL